MLNFIIDNGIFKNMTTILPFYVFLILISLIFASTLTIGSLSDKLKFSYLLLIAVIIGSVLLFIFYSLIKVFHLSINITYIVIGFIFILGIMIIVLLSTKKENFQGINANCPNIIKENNKYVYTSKYYPNEKLVSDNTITLQDGMPCIKIKENGKHQLTHVKYGYCGGYKAIYGSVIDGADDQDEQSQNEYIDSDAIQTATTNEDSGLGLQASDIDSAADIEAQIQEEEDELSRKNEIIKGNINKGSCIANEESCVYVKGFNQKGFNKNDYMVNYCKTKYGDLYGVDFNTNNITKCCTKSDPKGTNTISIKCSKGTFNGIKYKPGEVISMTKCIPLTSDFNYSCRYSNPPCSHINYESSCKGECVWDSNSSICSLEENSPYEYGNYSPQDFGYEKILKGIDGNCLNTYGRAICSPDYNSGVRKVPNSTSCLNMDSTDFPDSCINNYGYNQDIVGESNSLGCNPEQTRKICNINKEKPIKYMGCYRTKSDNTINKTNIKSAIECIEYCNKNNASNKYAAITKGNQCACSPTYTNFIYDNYREDKCNMFCDEGFSRNCGGSSASSVYKL